VADNLLMGGGDTIAMSCFGVRVRHTVTGNKVVNQSWDYGPTRVDCAQTTWTGNTVVTVDANYRVTGTVRALPCSG
jgi:hypothetical protein